MFVLLTPTYCFIFCVHCCYCFEYCVCPCCLHASVEESEACNQHASCFCLPSLTEEKKKKFWLSFHGASNGGVAKASSLTLHLHFVLPHAFATIAGECGVRVSLSLGFTSMSFYCFPCLCNKHGSLYTLTRVSVTKSCFIFVDLAWTLLCAQEKPLCPSFFFAGSILSTVLQSPYTTGNVPS